MMEEKLRRDLICGAFDNFNRLLQDLHPQGCRTALLSLERARFDALNPPIHERLLNGTVEAGLEHYRVATEAAFREVEKQQRAIMARLDALESHQAAN
jgi:hypothetical protein